MSRKTMICAVCHERCERRGIAQKYCLRHSREKQIEGRNRARRKWAKDHRIRSTETSKIWNAAHPERGREASRRYAAKVRRLILLGRELLRRESELQNGA